MKNPKATKAEVMAMRARIIQTRKALKAAMARADMEDAHTAANNVRMYERWIECYA